MTNVDVFWGWVDTRMEELNIKSFRELERKAGISHGSISKKRSDQKLPSVEMAESLCRVLKVTWLELWAQTDLVQQVDDEYLTGVDAELQAVLKDKDDEFKRALLATAKAWSLYEELKK